MHRDSESQRQEQSIATARAAQILHRYGEATAATEQASRRREQGRLFIAIVKQWQRQKMHYDTESRPDSAAAAIAGLPMPGDGGTALCRVMAGVPPAAARAAARIGSGTVFCLRSPSLSLPLQCYGGARRENLN